MQTEVKRLRAVEEKVALVLLCSDFAVSARFGADAAGSAHTRKKEKSPCAESTHGQAWRAGGDRRTALDVRASCCPQGDTI